MGRARTPERKEQFDKFMEYCDRVGIWNVVLTHYEEKTGIPNQTLSTWKKKYLAQKGKLQIEQFTKEMHLQGQAALKRLAWLSQSKDTGISLKASRAVLDSGVRFMELCQKLNIVPKDQEEPQVIISASDKELYQMLNKSQRQKIAKMAENK